MRCGADLALANLSSMRLLSDRNQIPSSDRSATAAGFGKATGLDRPFPGYSPATRNSIPHECDLVAQVTALLRFSKIAVADQSRVDVLELACGTQQEVYVLSGSLEAMMLQGDSIGDGIGDFKRIQFPRDVAQRLPNQAGSFPSVGPLP